MKGEFEVVSKHFVPAWRRPKKRNRVLVAEAVMALASVTGLLLVWAPWRDPHLLQTAISLQFARGDGVAAALFLFMALVLLLMAVRLWRASRMASALLMGIEVAALALLSKTDPDSLDHLFVFAAVAVASAGWLVVLAIDLEDPWLGVASLGGVAALCTIPVSLGIGERALITSCLAGMNLMFFRHFD